MRENKNARTALVQRRSQRIVMSAPVVVSGTYTDQRPAERMIDQTGKEPAAFDEQTETISVNFHGAMILLSVAVQIGQTVCLRHERTQEEAQAEVRYVGGRQAGKTRVGIEFCKPAAHFWHLAFPPDDWSVRRAAIEQTNH